MSCQDVLDLLDDVVDGTAGPEERAAVLAHLSSCAACAAEERLARALREQGRRLPSSLAPPRDLWPEVAERIAAERSPRARWLVGLATAAAVVMGLVSLTHRGPATAPAAPAAVVGSVRPAAGWESAEAAYAAAADDLLGVLQARGTQLPPATRAVVDKNLAAIDRALDEIRSALATDPGNPRLNHLLASTHQRKVNVLQSVVKLSREL
jgi:anti-sigma factor RsiW